jgi:NAD(P)-dependent dehydrogenase (short-subunit alcohol dehydrogenase family)
MFEGIRDKKVLITGASGGIGAAMAELFALHGAVVGIHYHKGEEKARRLREAIEGRGGRAECFGADLLESGERMGLIPRFIDTFGTIDVLINNAGGIIGNSHFLELDEESWIKTLALNTLAPFFLAQQAFAYMMRHAGGRIINISSISAKYGGSPTSLHYGAAKAALEAIAVGLARQGASHNILVNSIRPGVIETPFHRKSPKANMDERIKLIPLGRMGQPLDVARLALFLASEAGDYITGQIFTVSGGD